MMRGAGVVAAQGRWSRGRPAAESGPVVALGLLYALVLLAGARTLVAPHLTLLLAPAFGGTERIAWVAAGSPTWDAGLRGGEQVVTLDAQRPAMGDAGLWRGQRVQARSARGALLTLDERALAEGCPAGLLAGLSAWCVLLAALIGLRATDRDRGQAASLVLGSAAFALLLDPLAVDGDLVATVSLAPATQLFCWAFLRCALRFDGARYRLLWSRCLALPPLLVGALYLALLPWPALYPVAHALGIAVMGGYLLAGAAVLARRLVAASRPGGRRGMTLISVSMAVAVLPLALLSTAPLGLGYPVLLSAQHAALGLVALPLGLTYAISRHQVLGVRRVAQRWLARGLVGAVLLLLCMAAVVMPHWSGLWDRLDNGSDLLLAAALVAGVTLLLGGLRVWLWRWIDGRFFGDSYGYQATLRALICMPADAGHDLISTLLLALRALLNLEFVALVVDDEHGPPRVVSAGDPPPALVTRLAGRRGSPTAAPASPQTRRAEPGVWVTPLSGDGAAQGLLCCGPKRTGEPLRAQDQDLLTTLAGHLGAAVRRIQLEEERLVTLESLREQNARLTAQRLRLQAVNAQLLELGATARATLAADLHDAPLRSAQRLHAWLLTHPAQAADLGEAVTLSGLVVTQLRGLCAALRPDALGDLGLCGALRLLAREQAARSGIPITLEAAAEVNDLDLTHGEDILLYQAAQEVVGNALRHAAARQITLTLSTQGSLLQLTIADDGCGFVVPERLADFDGRGHYGLSSLQERLTRRGAWLLVHAAPGQGARVCIALPVGGATP